MKLSVLSCVFLTVFCVSAAAHLVRCWQGSPKSRYTKPLLVSSLLLFCAFAAPSPNLLLLAALFASWAGDVLLMPKGSRWFVAGGIAFLISHALFLFVYLPHIGWAAAGWAAPIAAAVYLAVSAAVMRAIWKETPGAMRVPMFLYLAANGTMNVFALSMLVGAPCPGAALAYAGAVLFFASDAVLFLSRYYKKKDRIPRRGFLIMLTYIAGEALIAFGVLLLENGARFGAGG